LDVALREKRELQEELFSRASEVRTLSSDLAQTQRECIRMQVCCVTH
jgi:uncharacterized protein YlxW (UPF0749 family)